MRNILIAIIALSSTMAFGSHVVGTNSVTTSVGYTDVSPSVVTGSLEVTYGLSRGLIGVDALVMVGYGNSDLFNLYSGTGGVRVFTQLAALRPFIEVNYTRFHANGKGGIGSVTDDTWSVGAGFDVALSEKWSVMGGVYNTNPDTGELWSYVAETTYWLFDSVGVQAGLQYAKEGSIKGYSLGAVLRF